MNSMHTPRYSPFIAIVYSLSMVLFVYMSYGVAYVWKIQGVWLNILVTFMIVLSALLVLGFAERYSVRKYMENKYGKKHEEDPVTVDNNNSEDENNAGE